MNNNIDKEKESSLSFMQHDKGFLYTADGPFYELDGEHYDSIEGKDKDGWNYDKYGKYIPGSDFNQNLGAYKKILVTINLMEMSLKKK